jgi:hypothetical protein
VTDTKFIEGALVLHPFLIDVVKPVEYWDEDTDETSQKVQLVTYKVLAQSPDHAIKRFFEEEAGVEVYRGDLSDAIVVGMQIDQAGIYNG